MIKYENIKKIKSNQDNPRIIKDDKFFKLVKSIEEFPKMLELRPIVVDSDMVVLGGNMRLKACIEAGLKKVPILIAEDLTEEQKKEFIIKDNVSFGEWDWEVLNAWEVPMLQDWGLNIWQPETMYEPNVDPTASSSMVTDADIEKTESKMGFEQNISITTEVICPACGEEFIIKKQ